MNGSFDRADTARTLETLVRIQSISRAEHSAAEFFVATLGERGFRPHIDAAGNVIGAIGEGGPSIALVGHIDTVPGDLPVHVTDGVLHGRGSVDAKGPLVTLAAAARRAHDAGAQARFIVVGCVEEEVASSKGAVHLADTWDVPPDALIIGEPSAWDGVTLGYKGILSGEMSIELGSAHGAHEGESAPEAASDLWQAIAAAARAYTPDDAALFDRILPRLRAMRCEHDGEVDRAILDLALRLPPSLHPAAARAWLAALGSNAQLHVTGEAEAWRGPRTSPVARAMSRAILGAGGKPRFQVKTGTADLNVLAPRWGCPAVAYGPGDAALDHTAEERVSLDEVEKAVDVLSHALVGMAAAIPRTEAQVATTAQTPQAGPKGA